jgi:hypothetical protein
MLVNIPLAYALQSETLDYISLFFFGGGTPTMKHVLTLPKFSRFSNDNENQLAANDEILMLFITVNFPVLPR